TGVIATIDTTEALDPLRTSSPPPAPNGTIPATLANLGVGIAALCGSADGTVVAPAAITDPTAEAKVLAGITGLDAATLENRLHAVANQGGDTQAVVLGTIPATVTATIGS